MTTSQCIFCKIAQDTEHPAPIYRDDQVIVLRDIHPKAPVHLLIIPTMHLKSMAHIDRERAPLLGYMLMLAEQMASQEGVHENGFRLVINQGDNGGQTIEHLHLHLLGGKKLKGMG